MVYFLVNNNYHLLDLEKHLPKFGELDVSLILVPHTLDEEYLTTFQVPQFRFEPILLSKAGTLLPWSVLKQKQMIRSAFDIGPSDTLVIYTEHELVNQMVAMEFHRQGSRLMLLEEGLATYVEHCFEHNDRMRLSKRILYRYLLWIAGLKGSRLSGSNTLSPTFMDDRVFSKALLYMNVRLNRNIDILVVDKDYDRIADLEEDSLIFLNEDNYNFYEPMDSYLSGLERLLKVVSQGFTLIHFKFHPREYRESSRKLEQIRAVVAKFPNVKELRSKDPVEHLARSLKAKYVMSYMSIGLINLSYLGLEPMFVHTLFPNLASQDDFRKVTEVLALLGYEFITTEGQIARGYRSGLLTNVNSIPFAKAFQA